MTVVTASNPISVLNFYAYFPIKKASAYWVSDRTISLRAFASPILGAPVVSRLRSALHTDPSGRRPLRTDTISL